MTEATDGPLVEHEHSFEHNACIYSSDGEYVAALAPFLRAGLAEGAPALAVVPARRAELLREALGEHAGAVAFIDAESWYRVPAATIAGYEGRLRELAVGARAYLVGEVGFGSSGPDWTSWTRYESMVNDLFARYSARAVCPYDARALAPAVLRDAERTHPFLLDTRPRRPSAEYAEPDAFLRQLPATVRLPQRPPDSELGVTWPLHRLSEARRCFAELAERAGFGPARVEELALALSEVLANALVHGGGVARQRVWCEGAGIVCTVEDHGTGLKDPLAGFRPPPLGAESGRGLWLARHLFEHSDLICAPGGGTLVCLASTA